VTAGLRKIALLEPLEQTRRRVFGCQSPPLARSWARKGVAWAWNHSVRSTADDIRTPVDDGSGDLGPRPAVVRPPDHYRRCSQCFRFDPEGR